MLKLIFLQLLHGIKVLRDWNVTCISVDGSWTLRHVLENVADSRYERDSWTIDTALRGLQLVCKVGLSLTVDNALEFGKYFQFILQGGGEGSGVAQFGHCEMLDYACNAHFFIMEIDISKKKKPCALLNFTSSDQKSVIKFVGLRDEYEDSSEKHQ